ncbi:MAG: DNA polymerase III subunit delta' [Cyanobacteria bacterium J06648_16]
MVSPVLATPRSFDAVIGQTQAVTLLKQSLARQRIAPGYLFLGPDGVGKGLTARAFAESLLSLGGANESIRRRIEAGNHPDLLWVEPTYLHQNKLLTVQEAAEVGLKRRGRPQVRLAQIRQIAQFLSRPPLESSRSAVVIESAELMAEAAANGLLKTLEEPGRATVILLAPTQQSLLPTIVSRCQTVPFVRLGQADLATVLTQTGFQEILDAPEVMAMAQGSPGSAIASHVQRQSIPPELLEVLAQPPRSTRAALTAAKQITQELDTEAQLWLVDYLQQRYWQLALANPAAVPPATPQMLATARQHLTRFVQPRLVWEVTLMQLADAVS